MSHALQSISSFQAETIRAFNSDALSASLYPFVQNKFDDPRSFQAIRPAGQLFSKPSFPFPPFGEYGRGLSFNFSEVSHVATQSMWKSGVVETPRSLERQPKLSKEVKVAKVTERIETGSEMALLGPLVLGASGFISGVSGALRGVHSGINLISAQDDPAALSVLAATSGFKLLTGPFDIYDGWENWKTSEKVKDRWGQFLTAKKMTGAAVQIAAVMTGSKVVGSVASVFGQLGGGVSSLFSLLGIIVNVCEVYLERLFAANIGKKLGDTSLPEDQRYLLCLQDLKSQLKLSPNEKAEIRQEAESDPELKNLSKEERERNIQEMEEKAVRKKELQMARVTDRECVEKVKSARIEEAKEVVEKVCKANTKKMKMSWISISLSVVSFIGVIIALVFTGGTPLIIAAALGLFASVGFLLVDGCKLLQDFKTGESGRYDHLWIFISTVFCFVAVTAAFLLASGLPAIIAAGSLGLIWLSINVACFIRLRHRQKMAQISSYTKYDK